MDTAAAWAAASPRATGTPPDDRSVRAVSISNLTRAQQLEAMGSAAPVFGGRRQWLDYVGETTGFGSLEMSRSSAHRVTLIRPGDAEALREHHRLVLAGRLTPSWPRPPLGAHRVHVLDRDELLRTRADAHDSWLVAAQGVARLCATDDQVAALVGGSLRHILWSGREHLAAAHVVLALTELGQAAHELAAERIAHRDAVERMIRRGRRPDETAGEVDAEAEAVGELTRREIESIRLEARALSAVRTEWDGVA